MQNNGATEQRVCWQHYKGAGFTANRRRVPCGDEKDFHRTIPAM